MFEEKSEERHGTRELRRKNQACRNHERNVGEVTAKNARKEETLSRGDKRGPHVRRGEKGAIGLKNKKSRRHHHKRQTRQKKNGGGKRKKLLPQRQRDATVPAEKKREKERPHRSGGGRNN